MSSHFAGEDLARIRLVEDVPLPAPILKNVAAITFDHVVVSRQPIWDSLLFHELVHVVQFRLLGVPLFSKLYVGGFLETHSYQRIPLEACAFELEDRYLRGASPLNVEAEIRRRFLR